MTPMDNYEDGDETFDHDDDEESKDRTHHYKSQTNTSCTQSAVNQKNIVSNQQSMKKSSFELPQDDDGDFSRGKDS